MAAAALTCMVLRTEAAGLTAGSVGAALSWARIQGCSSRSRLGPLHEDAHLRDAARRLAGGSSLHAALVADGGYVARQSFELRITSVQSEMQLRQVLVKGFCKTLTDPGVRDFGAERRGDDVWIALAAPLELPAKRDAATIERNVLLLVNDARAVGRHCGTRVFGPAPALRLNSALTVAAQAHSDDMAAHGEFEHRGHDGSSPVTRVERAGFGPYRIVGENIAAGAASAQDVTQGWLASVPHCENIMDPRFTQIGIAYSINTARDSAIYWTQDFATSR